MRFLLKLIGGSVSPVTHLNVAPAGRDEMLEAEIRSHRARTAEAVIAGERASWEIRRALAGNVLSIVQGN